MAVERRHTITCDHPTCAACIWAETKYLATKRARAAGWTRANGHDWCHAHTPKPKP